MVTRWTMGNACAMGQRRADMAPRILTHSTIRARLARAATIQPTDAQAPRLTTSDVAISSSSSAIVAWPEQSNGLNGGSLAVLEQQRRIDLGEVDLAHGPAAEPPLADLLEAQDAHVLVAVVAHDRVVELADFVTAALEHLDEQVVAVAEDAGDADASGCRARDCSRIESCTDAMSGAVARLA